MTASLSRLLAVDVEGRVAAGVGDGAGLAVGDRCAAPTEASDARMTSKGRRIRANPNTRK